MLVMLANQLLAQHIMVDKVEPMNWWVGMKHNKVQLMLYGKELTNLKASFQEKKIKVLKIHTLDNANYCFIDIEIPANLVAGTYHLVLKNGNESKVIAYPILTRENKANRYQGFNNTDVMYLITPDRFANADENNDKLGDNFDEFDVTIPHKRHGGDIKGIIQHLDYLKNLGITTIWINPLLENNGKYSYHGYACTDLYKIDARFGINEDYKTLIAEAHKLGLKVVFDHVNNHIGIHHQWMSNYPMQDWIHGTISNHFENKHHKAAIIDPHADPTSEPYLYSFWFDTSMPDMNQHNVFMANYLIQNTLWWIEYAGIDGIREDTYPYTYQDYLNDWIDAILLEYPDFNIVGEVWEYPSASIAAFQKNTPLNVRHKTHLPAVMDFALMKAYRDYLEGKGRINDIYNVFANDFLYADVNNLLVFLDNHDITRAPYITPKDQQAKVIQALTMLMTTRGIPQLLYGTEIGMIGGENHPELRQDFPGGFKHTQHDAFKARTAAEEFYFLPLQKLLHLRQQYPTLATGKFTQYPLIWADEIYKYTKSDDKNTFLIILNGNNITRKIDLSEIQHLIKVPQAVDILSDKTYNLKEGFSLPAYGVIVLKLK